MISCTVPGSVVVPGAHWDSRLSSWSREAIRNWCEKAVPGRLIITSPPTPGAEEEGAKLNKHIQYPG